MATTSHYSRRIDKTGQDSRAITIHAAESQTRLNPK
jgi:hypothetical protein